MRQGLFCLGLSVGPARKQFAVEIRGSDVKD